MDSRPPEIDQFFDAIAPIAAGYRDHTFSYLAIRRGDRFLLLQGRLTFNSAAPTGPFTHFETNNVRAGCYRLKEDLGPNPRELIEHLLSGNLSTPEVELDFSPQPREQHSAAHVEFHPAGLESRTRISLLSIVGAGVGSCLKQPSVDWEVKASPTPYDGLQELAFEYGLGQLRGDVALVEVVAQTVVMVDARSRVDGQTAKIAVRAALGLATEKIQVGYRVFSQGRCCDRSAVRGSAITWREEDGIRVGEVNVTVPDAAVVDCITSYDGNAQHHWWIRDLSKAQNPRRAAYETVDPGLKILRDNLAKTGKGRDQDDFESGVAWLLWMMGFSPAHVGTDKRFQSADLIVASPAGHFAVVECTTGLLKADTKMARVIERAEVVRAQVQGSGLRVLPVMVTSKTRAEVKADLEEAERHGVLVVCRENLEEAVDVQTLPLPNADAIYDKAERAVRDAQARHSSEPKLDL